MGLLGRTNLGWGLAGGALVFREHVVRELFPLLFHSGLPIVDAVRKLDTKQPDRAGDRQGGKVAARLGVWSRGLQFPSLKVFFANLDSRIPYVIFARKFGRLTSTTPRPQENLNLSFIAVAGCDSRVSTSCSGPHHSREAVLREEGYQRRRNRRDPPAKVGWSGSHDFVGCPTEPWPSD